MAGLVATARSTEQGASTFPVGDRASFDLEDGAAGIL